MRIRAAAVSRRHARRGGAAHASLTGRRGHLSGTMLPSGQTLITKATYLIGPRGPEYRRDDQTGAPRWYVYDGLGSVLRRGGPRGQPHRLPQAPP
jgi:hypothetical protein